MRTLKIFSTLFIIILFSKCSGLKLQENPPFKIIKATYENWVGGQPGVKGINLKITYSPVNAVQFEDIYFSEKVTKLEIKNNMLFAYYITSSINNDMVLHSEATKEINNSIPKIKKFPFNLKKNQAVISYKIEGKIKYYKINSLVEQKSTNYK